MVKWKNIINVTINVFYLRQEVLLVGVLYSKKQLSVTRETTFCYIYDPSH